MPLPGQYVLMVVKLGVIAALSDRFNPEMVSAIGVVNDNYNDTLEDMRRAFGI